jgi:hypothetical protein
MHTTKSDWRRGLWAACLIAACGGCAHPKPVVAGTGAADAARRYYEAILHRDWPAAYAIVHPESRVNLSQDQYDGWADSYRQSLGFEPQAVYVRSCTEQATEAVAHIVIVGRSSRGERRYRDGAWLRRTAAGWGVILFPDRTQGQF